MKIVLLCNEYPPLPHAGIGTAVHSIACGLSGRGHDVTVLGLGGEDGETTDEDVRVVTLRGSKLPFVGNLISRLRLRRWLSSRAAAGTIDVIEAPDAQGLLPFGVDGCAVAIRLHNSFSALHHVTGQKLGRGIAFYEKRTLATNRDWIAVSDHVMDLARATFGVTPKRKATIYNPAPPLPSVLPVQTGLPARYILHAGHVRRRKGADVLAIAAREIMAEQPDLHLIYAGGIADVDDRPMPELIREVLGPKLAERVHFLGHVDREKVLALMTRASVFVLPSLVEGFPMVVLEAMSCGVPVVFSRHPPGPEIIDDGVSGLLADPSRPEEFREKIRRILDDPAFARSLAGHARKLVAERFTVKNCVEATERFYEQCLSDREETISP